MFIGREHELELLRRSNWRKRAELVVIYGRRRVGKTALVEKAYEDKLVWKFEGLENTSTKKQIEHFIFSLLQYTQDDSLRNIRAVRSWEEALVILDRKIGKKNLIIFFDEFQWMANMRSTLVSAFKWAWDNYFIKHTGCCFILCGSISSFIVKKVIKSSALYGRIDLEINLKPFNLHETYKFFSGKRTKTETLNIYITLGGIPQYLMELDPKKSLTQNLSALAFTPHGYFFREYQRIFISHFSKNINYEKILKSLSIKHTQTSNDLQSFATMKTGGTFTELLDDLELAGFIERFHPIDKQKKSKLLKMRLHDEFLHFYFNFVDKNSIAIEEKTIKAYELLTGHLFEQWRGYALERLVRKHAKYVARALEFSGIRYEYGSWFRFDTQTKVEIDLLFTRADKVLTVCEIKYVMNLKNEVIKNFENKLALIQKYFPRANIQKVLILGEKINIPQKIVAYFDFILYAEEIFLVD